MQFSTAVRNARMNAIEATVGASALLELYTGSLPASCVASPTGTLLTTMTLPSTWMASASGGAVALAGTWTQTAAAAAGTAGYFRILDPTGTTCHVQGTVSMGGGGGDMILDNTNIAVGQQVTINSFSLTDSNS